MTLKFNRFLEVVQVHVRPKFHIKLSAAVHDLVTVHWISDNSGLQSRISLERIKQSAIGNKRYQLRFFSTFGKSN